MVSVKSKTLMKNTIKLSQTSTASKSYPYDSFQEKEQKYPIYLAEILTRVYLMLKRVFLMTSLLFLLFLKSLVKNSWGRVRAKKLGMRGVSSGAWQQKF